MAKLKYIGNRKRDITLQGAVTGKTYYLEIAKGEITIDQRDADSFTETGDWQAIEPEVEVMPTIEEAPSEPRRKRD